MKTTKKNIKPESKKKELNIPDKDIIPESPKKNPIGRPPFKYSEELANKICELISTSNKGLHTICKENKEFPSYTVIYEWLNKNKIFADKYARAKETQADFLADEIIEIADHSGEDHTPFTGKNVVDRDKLRVDARKWVAAKLKPKKYGDRIQQDISNEDGSLQNLTNLPLDELEKRLEIIQKIENSHQNE